MSTAGIGTPFWYEWEIGLLKCIEMLYNDNIRSVVFQDPRFESLDDVVVNYVNGSSINIQVKHTDVGSNFSFSTLLYGDKPMLIKWASDWQKSKSEIREINIITNKPFGPKATAKYCSFKKFVKVVLPEWQSNFNYVSSKQNENNAIQDIKKALSFLKDDMFEFIKILKFKQEKDKDELEIEFNKRLSTVLGTSNPNIISNIADKFYSQLRFWATSSREQVEIDREEVYQIICNNQISLPNFEDINLERPIFPSRKTFKDDFIKHLRQTNKKIIFLKGLPGTGKTNFVSYLAKTEDSIIDFNFYTYKPVTRGQRYFSADSGYYSGAFLWRYLLNELKNKFSKLKLLWDVQFPLTYGFMEINEMRSTALKFLAVYAEKIKRTCYVFIDGIDHAARSRQAANETYLSQLPLPREIQGDVKIILVGQPLNNNYPSWFDNNDNSCDVVNLPVLSTEDVLMLLANRHIQLEGVDIKNLANKIIEVVGNNALNILYAIEELKEHNYTFEKIIDELCEKKLNCEISRYYDYILSHIEDDICTYNILVIFAFATQKIKCNEIALLCSCQEGNIAYKLNKLYPLIQKDGDCYFIYHNDARLFFKNQILKNSSFHTVLSSLKQNIIQNECLSSYKYTFLFDAYSELNDESLFDIYTPEYIIKSTLYEIPITKLTEQFWVVFDLIYSKKLINKLVYINLCCNTLYQYVSSISYYGLTEKCFQDYNQNLVQAEKYILDYKQNFVVIVQDIFSLIKANFINRAEKLFNEYFKCFDENWLNALFNNREKQEVVKNFGFICRYFDTKIIKNGNLFNTSLYCYFVSGWLEASINFIDSIKDTFLFEKYYEKDLFDYIKSIVPKLDINSLKFLSGLFQKGKHSILFLIEICSALIFKGHRDDALIGLIFSRMLELKEKTILQYDMYKISYFIKMIFCIFTKIDYTTKNTINILYKNILKQVHIIDGARGYLPAMEQLNIAFDIYKAFYNNMPTENTVEQLYALAYFGERFGAGSINDCNSYDVIPFLNKVIFNLYENQKDKQKCKDACNKILPLYIGVNPKFKEEYLPLFSLSNENEYISTIAEFWAGENGYIWQSSYDTMDEICNCIINELEKCGLKEKARRITITKSLKKISYTNHKDYSIFDILEWFNKIPTSEEKFYLGFELLTISDIASEIGDNRAAHSVNEEIFKIAVELGPKYIDALFDIKNNPKEIINWREYLLTELLESVNYKAYSDGDLVELHRLANSWINLDIEKSKKYDRSLLGFLAAYNKKIIQSIKNTELKRKLQRSSFLEDNADKEESSTEHKANEEYQDTEKLIISIYKQQGISKQLVRLLCDYTKENRYGTYNFLVNFGTTLQTTEREIFTKEIVLPYILQKNEYGLYGSGLDILVTEFGENFCTDDYFDLLQNSVRRLVTFDPDNYFGVNEDFNKIILNFAEKHGGMKYENVAKDKLSIHRLWITACGNIGYNPYIVNLNSDINSFVDFNRKYI